MHQGESGPKERVPQDLVAIFHASFHPTQGNVVDWSLKASEALSLDSVEFSTLPSGLHLVESDVVYFTKDEHQGVCVFRRRETTERGHRGFRLSSLGILLAKSPRSKPWRHVSALQAVVDNIYSSLENRAVLEPTESDWEPARAFFEERKVRRADLGGAGDWNGWDAELDEPGAQTHPTIHLPHLLRILGPSSLILYKHVLGRRRILIYTLPPVQAACTLCQVAADLCYEQQVTLEDSTDDNHPEGIKVLGMVTLSDLDKMRIEGESGRGWVACTTDAIFLEKPAHYDLLIDLTTSTPNKSSRPTFYLPKAVEQSGKTPSYRLSVVRFTWTDVKLWTELDRLLQVDQEDAYSCCGAPSNTAKSRAGITAAWSDMWRVYEDVCVVCAGLWMSNWRGNSIQSYSTMNGRIENWGSVRLEGDDNFALRKGVVRSYVRNVGMGIEGRPAVEVDGLSPSNKVTRSARRVSSLSTWTLTSNQAQTEETLASGSTSRITKPNIDEAEDADAYADRTGRHILTTLALLQTFHTNTTLLITRLQSVLPPPRPLIDPTVSSDRDIVYLTPKDLVAFELGPLSPLDARLVEWLSDEYGRGTRVVVRRGWREFVGLLLGFG